MAKLNKRARHKRRGERTARELAIARSKPAPTLPPHINKDRPPMGCILIPGTGWPMLSAPGKTYNEIAGRHTRRMDGVDGLHAGGRGNIDRL